MIVKFNAKTMPKYAGHDGKGGMVSMVAGDTAEVTEMVGKLLLSKYGQNFEVVIQEAPAHSPTSDKLYRKSAKTKTK